MYATMRVKGRRRMTATQIALTFERPAIAAMLAKAKRHSRAWTILAHALAQKPDGRACEGANP